jgi:hypothetical protein
LHIRIWNIMKAQQQIMSPLDIVVLLKITTYGDEPWYQKSLAEALYISQSEISKSLARSKYAGLLDPTGKIVMKLSLMDFLTFGIRYVFPQQPGPVVRGIPTAHSAPPLSAEIQSAEPYVWPYGKGTVRGHSILPLYPSVVKAVANDTKLYELLAMVDALRVGRAREKNLAISELNKRIVSGEQNH